MTARPAPLPTHHTDLIANAFDALPLAAFVVDHDFNIVEFNLAGAKLLDRIPFAVLRLRGGTRLECIHSTESMDGDGAACEECISKNFVREVFSEAEPGRYSGRLRLAQEGQTDHVDFLITVAPVGDEAEPLALLLLDHCAELRELLQAKRHAATLASSSPDSKARAKVRVRKTGNN